MRFFPTGPWPGHKDRHAKARFQVSDVVRSEKERKPYPPFITSTIQQEAARKLGFSAAKTMMVAQQLYEGLELGELGSLGLITYMRTDSTRIAQEAIADVRKVITGLFGCRTQHEAGKRRMRQVWKPALRVAPTWFMVPKQVRRQKSTSPEPGPSRSAASEAPKGRTH